MKKNLKQLLVALVIPLYTQGVDASTDSISPYLIEDDVITFYDSGGSVDPENPDIYVIEMGEFKDSTYTIRLERPKGAQANYPVKIEAMIDPGNFNWEYPRTIKWDSPDYQSNYGIGIKKVTFNPGETSKTISVVATGQGTDANILVAFISFSHSSRTKTAQSVVQLNFRSPDVVTATAPRTDDSIRPSALRPHAVGQYILFDNKFSGKIKINEDQTLKFRKKRIDHETVDIHVTDSSSASFSDTISLIPRNIGQISDNSIYLHKITEEDVIPLLDHGWEQWKPFFCYELAGINNLVDAYNDNIFDGLYTYSSTSTYISLTDTGRPPFYAPLRFEPLKADSLVYKGYSVGEIKTRIKNRKFYTKANYLTEEKALKNIQLSVFNRVYDWKEYDPVTEELTFRFDIPVNNTGRDTSFFAEIKVLTEDKWHSESIYPYGAYTSFTISTEKLGLTFVDTIEVSGFPENNYIFSDDYGVYPEYRLQYLVQPANATQKCVWSSSNPDVATIDENGIIRAVNPGITIIKLTSDEVGRRQDEGLEANDKVLIKEFKIIVNGISPKLSIQPKQHRFEDETVIEYYHNFKVTDWTVDSARIEIYDALNNKKESLLFQIDTAGNQFKNGIISYVMPFDEQTLPKIYSQLNAENEYTPVYRTDIALYLKNSKGTTTTTIEYPVYILFPATPEVRITGEKIQSLYKGVNDTVSYEINRLDKTGDYIIEYKVVNFKAQSIDNQNFVTSWDQTTIKSGTYTKGGTLPEWLVIESTAEDLSYVGKLKVIYVPKDPETEFDYTEIQLTVNNSTKGFKTNYSHTIHTKSSKLNKLNATYKSPASPNYLDMSQWEMEGIRLSELENRTGGSDYDSDALYDYIRTNWPSKILSFSYPSSWGNAMLKMGDDAKTHQRSVNCISTSRVDYPLKGGEYTVTLNWDNMDDSNKQYKYAFDNIEGKIYVYYVSGYDTGKPLFLEYTNGNNEKVSKNATCVNGFLCIYEPAGIKGAVFVRGTDKSNSTNFVYSTISDAKPMSSGSVFNASTSFDRLVGSNQVLTSQPDFKIRLYDKSGRQIHTGATIHYVTIDKSDNNKQISKGSQNSNNGVFAFTLSEDGSILTNTSYTQYVEIIAEGYLPQLLVNNKSGNYDVNAVLKEAGREGSFVKAQLLQSNQAEDLGNKSLSSVVNYSDYDNSAKLNIWLYLERGVSYSPNDFELKGNNARTKKPASCMFLRYNDIFKYDYAEIAYDINNFVTEQSTSYPSIVKGTATLTKLPGLKNTAINPSDVALALHDPLSFSMNPGGAGIADLSGIGNSVGGDFNRAFQNFDITLPSTLPVTLQITREGDEYKVRGIYSLNVIPGGDIMNQAELAADFEKLFNEISTQIKDGKSYGGNNNFLPNSAFVGFRGYLTGKGVYNPNKQGAVKMDFDFVDIGIKAELSGGYHTSKNIWGIVFGYGITGELSTDLSLQKPTPAEIGSTTNIFKSNIVLTNTLAIDLYAKLGVGIDLFIFSASAGIQGGGGGSHIQQAVFRPYDSSKTQAGFETKVNAYIKLWKEARFLFWTSRDETILASWNKSFYTPDNSSNPLKPSSKSLKSISDVYQRSNFTISGIIIENVESNAKPQYINGGNSLIYTNVKDIADYNDDRIQEYSSGVSNDINFSSTNAAYNFSASSSGNNSVVAYEELSENIDENDLLTYSEEDMIRLTSSKMEIVGAVKTGGNWNTTALTTNSFADKNPKTAMHGSNAVVVWTSGSFEKNADAQEDDAFNYYMNGDFRMSRFDGNGWSDNLPLLNVNKNNTLGQYDVAMADDGTVLISAARLAVSGQSGSEGGEILLVSVDPNNQVSLIETGLKGQSPQLKRFGSDRFILSCISVDQSDNQEDVYFAIVGKDGKTAGVSGFSGLTNKIPHNYKLVAKENASSFSDISIVWNESGLNPADDVETYIYAAKLGLKGERIYASMPVKVLDIPQDARVYSYDAFKADQTNMKVATVLANNNLGAVIVENEIQYQNSITCVSEHIPVSDIVPGAPLDIEFVLGNGGYLPIKSVQVNIDGNTGQDIDMNILPNYSDKIRANYQVPLSVNGNIPYTITATFDDDTKEIFSGNLDLRVVDLGVNLLSLNLENNKNTVVVEVTNSSPFPLDPADVVKVGLYKDIRGEELYPGTTETTVGVSELYANNANRNAVVSFEVNQPGETTTLFALVKSVNIKDKEQMDNSAAIQLYVEPRVDIPASYTVTIPQVQGISITPATSVVVNKNESITITVSPSQGYSISNMALYANGTPVDPDVTLGNGAKEFTIANITEDIVVTISGVTEISTSTYTVTIPQVEGISITPLAGIHTVLENASLTITVSALDGYLIDNMGFYVNGTLLQPYSNVDGEKRFMIASVTKNTEIAILGVTKKDDVANPGLSDGLVVYTTSGYIIIENNIASDSQDEVCIYNMVGTLLVKQGLPLGSTRIPMEKGLYLVVIGDKIFKVVI